MTKREERAGGVEQPRRPRTRVVAEAAVRGLSEEPPRLRTRVIAEAVVAAIPDEPRREPRVVSEEGEEVTPEGRAGDDDDDGS